MSNLDPLVWLPLAVALILMALIGTRLNKIQDRISELWRVEAKLDLLLKQANIQFDPFVHVPREIAEAVRAGKKIKAIKLQRQTSGMGLKEAKEFIEEIERQAGIG
jgi:ribosomal protein L7/L12